MPDPITGKSVREWRSLLVDLMARSRDSARKTLSTKPARRLQASDCCNVRLKSQFEGTVFTEGASKCNRSVDHLIVDRMR
jgi:hypothetical protein